MDDPLQVSQDIAKISETAKKMQDLAQTMQSAHKALSHLNTTSEGSTNYLVGVDLFNVGGTNFTTKFHEPAMSKGEQHLIDGIRVYLEERIRTCYERIQNLKDTF